MDELRKLAEKCNWLCINAGYLMMRARIFELHGILLPERSVPYYEMNMEEKDLGMLFERILDKARDGREVVIKGTTIKIGKSGWWGYPGRNLTLSSIESALAYND